MQAAADIAAWVLLRRIVVAAGVGASVLFVIVGLSTQLQMFGDGSIFSYAVSAQEAWAFHWHNISGRMFGYLYAHLPAEAVVALTGSAKAGIAAYGLLFFAAPLLSLLVTFFADLSEQRLIFVYACLSTACLCPLVYGAPTEMWLSHALFWPALAVCLYAPENLRDTAFVFAALLALVFTHEGGTILAGAILLAAFLRGWRDPIFIRAVGAFTAAMAIWLIVKITIRPDDYIAPVLDAAAFRFIDIGNLTEPVLVLLMATLAAYDIAVLLLRRIAPRRIYAYAVVACAFMLAVYWFWFDRSLLTEGRYNLRMLLLIMTPVFGIVAAIHAMDDEARHKSPLPFLAALAGAIERTVNPRLIAGAFVLTLLMHTIETTKFAWAWSEYKVALRQLAMSTESDPALGDPLFVSSKRIGPALNRLSWHSTTPYLSVLVAPAMKPARLVVDPGTNYFWLSCETAKRSERISTALPAESWQLIRIYSCLHR
jgi:hypothetical protein